MLYGVRLLVGCFLIQLSGLFADSSVTNSRQGYPIPVAWEVARLTCPERPLALCISHDGQTLYAADSTGQVTAWDTKSLAKKTDLPLGKSNNIVRLILSKDDFRLASCSGTSIVHVWDIKTGKLIYESEVAKGNADVAISNDGKKILTGGQNSPTRLVEVDSGKVLSEINLPDAPHGVNHLSFLDDDTLAAGADLNFHGFVFEPSSGQIKAKLGCQELIGMDASQKWLIAKGGPGFVFWSLADIKKACAESVPAMVPASSIPYGGWAQEAALTTISFDHWSLGNTDPSQAKVIDPRQGLVWPIYGDEPPGLGMGPIAISPDGKFLYQSWYSKFIRVLDLTKRPAAMRWITGSYNHSFAVDFEHGYLATGNLLAWERNTGLPIGCDTSGTSPYPDCVYWQNGIPYELIQILNIKPDQPPDPSGLPPANPVTLEKINLQTREVVKKFSLQANVHITVSQSGKTILIAYPGPPMHWKTPPDPKDPRAFFNPANMETDPSLQVLDADLNPIGKGFEISPDQGTANVAISPSDKFVAALAGDSSGPGSLKIFDLESRKQISPQTLAVDKVADFAVTDDGYLLVATTYGAISCFRAETGEKVAVIDQAHHHPIRKLALSPDNKTVATAGSDNLVKFWSVPDLKPQDILEIGSAPGRDGLLALGFYDSANLVAIPDLEPSQLSIVSLSQAFDEAKWNLNASAGNSTCVAISQDGKQVAIGELGGILTVVDNATGKQLYTVPAHAGGVKAVEFIKDTTQIKTYGADGKSFVWDLATSSNPISEATDKPNVPVINIKSAQAAYSFSFQYSCTLPGDLYLALYSEPKLYIYSLKTEHLIWAYDSPAQLTGMVYDPLNQQLLTSHTDGVTRRWELPALVKGSASQ